MRKIIAFTLATAFVLMSLFSLASCGPYSDEEAGEIIDELLKKEAKLNGYIYGGSFKTEKDPGDDVNSTYQKYYTVAEDSEYYTLSALKSAVDEIIAETSREEIYKYAFEGDLYDDTSIPPRFAEDEEGNLQINVADNAYNQMRTVAKLGTVKVKRSTKSHIKAEITVIRTTSSGEKREATKEVEIILEDGSWKLISQTMIIGVEE